VKRPFRSESWLLAQPDVGFLLPRCWGTPGVGLSVALSDDQRLVASCSVDRTIRLWEVGTGQPLTTLQCHTAGISGVGVSADRRLVAGGGLDGSVPLSSLATGELLTTPHRDWGGVGGVALSADGLHVAAPVWTVWSASGKRQVGRPGGP
jgi:WD40 repeat protein